jgi:endonuclease/exonuclease/phosphatase family metal-dependent hydrolase
LKWPTISARGWCRGAALLTAILLGGVWAISHGIGESTWYGTAVCYAPRVLWLVPVAALIVAGCICDRVTACIGVCLAGIVAGPIMDYRFSMTTSRIEAGETLGRVAIASCNVQGYRPRFASVIAEVSRHSPDIILFQEALQPTSELVSETWPGWHTHHVEHLLVISRWPIEPISAVECPHFHRVQGQLLRVEHPDGPFALLNVHLMTARRGLTALKDVSEDFSEAAATVETHEAMRSESSQLLRLGVEEARGELPLLVAGDFNTPSSAGQYQSSWGDLTNAFDAAGRGYGFTSPCSSLSWWPKNTPWLRIDHVAASPEWRVIGCEVGRGNGSDHRPIFAELTRSKSGDN